MSGSGWSRNSNGKLRNNRGGMTILELLLAMLILGMVISLTAAGSRMVRSHYEDMKCTYDARIIADEILNEMEDWIRFSENPVVEEDEISYYDSVKGKKQVLSTGAWDILPYGLVFDRIDDERPVFTWDEGGRCILISFCICDSSGVVRAKVDNVAVRILNSL